MTKNYNLKVLAPILLLFFLILSGCSNDDDNPAADPFYKGAITSAEMKDLVGIWSIYEAEYEGEKASVPISIQECGRDFFMFMENGKYKEYAFTSSECDYKTNEIDWSLNEGIVYIGPNIPQSDEMVLIGLDEEKLVFRLKIDIDEDGVPDILTFTARRYTLPNDMDVYSSSFEHNSWSPHNDKIRFTWQPYKGINSFDRYEIYRSNNECSKSGAELIATITEENQGFFIDEDPPVEETFCYFFRIYNDRGLLGESELVSVDTDYLYVSSSVKLDEPVASGETIELNWEKYEGYYFSHYEITVKNFESGSGAYYLEEVIAEIDDIETTNLTIPAPYVMNPIISIYVYDIFGNKSNGAFMGENSWELNFKRPEVLDFEHVIQTAIDKEETIIYFYAERNNHHHIFRFNYSTNTIEAVTADPLDVSSDAKMKIIQSADHGKEIVFPHGPELYVFDANSLEFKYKISTESVYFGGYDYLGNNLWAFTNADHVYTYKREDADLTAIDQESLNGEHHVNGNNVISINDNQIIIGHVYDSHSIKFTMDNAGHLTEKQTVDVPLVIKHNQWPIYNAQQNYIINFTDRELYSTESFTLLQSFEEPRFPSGISRDGHLILGSNNDPDWDINRDSPHERKVKIFDLFSQTVNTYESKGYPLRLFENHLGQIVSISSGLKQDKLEYISPPKPHLFVEVINQ